MAVFRIYCFRIIIFKKILSLCFFNGFFSFTFWAVHGVVVLPAAEAMQFTKPELCEFIRISMTANRMAGTIVTIHGSDKPGGHSGKYFFSFPAANLDDSVEILVLVQY